MNEQVKNNFKLVKYTKEKLYSNWKVYKIVMYYHVSNAIRNLLMMQLDGRCTEIAYRSWNL